MPVKDRRAPKHTVSPAYEDRGIFRMRVVSVAIWLMPDFARTARGDVVIRGLYNTGDGERLRVDTIFAGRRARFAEPLLRQLKPRAALTNTADRALPLHCQGAWR